MRCKISLDKVAASKPSSWLYKLFMGCVEFLIKIDFFSWKIFIHKNQSKAMRKKHLLSIILDWIGKIDEHPNFKMG